jgi:hypothetical protein
MLRTKAWSERWLEILFYSRNCGREGVIILAGNQTDARRRAQQEYEMAKRTGVNKRDLDKLFIAYAVAQDEENKACGTSYQARR